MGKKNFNDFKKFLSEINPHGLIIIGGEDFRVNKKELSKMKTNEFHRLDLTKFFLILIRKKFKIKALELYKHWFKFDSQKDLKVYEKYSRLNNI